MNYVCKISYKRGEVWKGNVKKDVQRMWEERWENGGIEEDMIDEYDCVWYPYSVKKHMRTS